MQNTFHSYWAQSMHKPYFIFYLITFHAHQSTFYRIIKGTFLKSIFGGFPQKWQILNFKF